MVPHTLFLFFYMLNLISTLVFSLGLAVNPQPQTPVCHDADFNKDGRIDYFDYMIFQDVYRTDAVVICNEDCIQDLDKDGKVSGIDFLLFHQMYGQVCLPEVEVEKK